ncbi:MAG: hypothetical protein IPP32_02690 [Bacteroidetes bacterium]|nr:hypothetical protein [Bacteroidota bacterium]
MNIPTKIYGLLVVVLLSVFACKKSEKEVVAVIDEPAATSGAKLIFKFKFDSLQPRLNNLGQNAPMLPGHAAQTPHFRKISAHYIELAPTGTTALGAGKVLYRAPEVTTGGANAIDFNQSLKVAEGETFFSVPISSVLAGNYQWLRVSLSYQNYDIRYKYNNAGGSGTANGTIASFLGFRTYVQSYTINTLSITENANKDQGYWGFETFGLTFKGQAPPGATTVPNPLFASSPIPPGSCVVTGAFASPLVLSGNESSDITITLSLSINKSFEWDDHFSPDGWYQPDAGDKVLDMGIRGLKPVVN